MAQADLIIIGGGINGLSTANYFAKHGKKVTLIESREELGGLSQILLNPQCFSPQVYQDLGLKNYELSRQKTTKTLLADFAGPGIVLGNDLPTTQKEISHYSSKDAKQFELYQKFMARVRPFLRSLLDRPLPDAMSKNFTDLVQLARTGVSLRGLGSSTMMNLLQVAPMCAADFLTDWFDSEILKAGLCGPAIYGSWAGPWSPGTAANLLIHEATAGQSFNGGTKALVRALTQGAQKNGVVLKTGQRVSQIVIENGAVAGVTLQDGEKISAALVGASCDPKSVFEKLVPAEQLALKFQERIGNFRTRGTTGFVHLTLEKPLVVDHRAEESFDFIRVGQSLNDLEKSFDSVKYGQLPSSPSLQMAPSENGNELAVQVHFAPYHLKSGWNDAAKEQLLSNTLAVIQKIDKNIKNKVSHALVTSPLDLETNYGTYEGHLLHGEPGLDQIICRPTPETVDYKTPIPGLFLCGSGSHPGGGITGRPARLAAQGLLK